MAIHAREVSASSQPTSLRRARPVCKSPAAVAEDLRRGQAAQRRRPRRASGAQKTRPSTRLTIDDAAAATRTPAGRPVVVEGPYTTSAATAETMTPGRVLGAHAAAQAPGTAAGPDQRPAAPRLAIGSTAGRL
jgi:hypothetical protein